MTVDRSCGWAGALLLGLGVTGCGDDVPVSGDAAPSSPDASPDALLSSPPAVGTCVEQMTLIGLDGGGRTGEQRRSLVLDPAGTTLCLTLDARTNIHVAQFYADTARELDGRVSSSFELFLFDAYGALLQRGRDVSYIPSNVFASLDYGVEVGTILEARLVARTRSDVSSAMTELRVALFEPFE